MKLLTVIPTLAMAHMAHAQSSVVTYGILDAGLTWTSSTTSGGHMLAVDTGVSQGSRLGFLGTEDLGGGLKSIFTLESGMNLDTGTLGQGGLIFGRQASVGLAGAYGDISFGRMFDVMGDIFPYYAFASNTPAGLLAWSLPFNVGGGSLLPNRVYGAGLNNTVRYRSPTYAGFSTMVTYSLGERTSSTSTPGNTFSGAITYKTKDFSVSLGTFQQADASVLNGDIEHYAFGAYYQFTGLRVFGMVSQVGYSRGTKAQVTTIDTGVLYNLAPNWLLGGGVQKQTRRNLDGAHQLTATLDYLLSKRTDVYLTAAHGYDGQYLAQAEALQGFKSDDSRQSAIRVGVRHKF